MPAKNIVLFFIFLFYREINFGQTTTQSATLISCTVQDKVDSFTTFSYLDGVFNPQWQDFNLLHSDNGSTCSFNFSFDTPHQVRVTHDYRYFEPFCLPGDKIGLTFNAQTYPTFITFSGDRAAENRFLHAFREEFLKYSKKEINLQVSVLNSLEFRRYMDNVYKAKWDFYHNYRKKHKEDWCPEFISYLQSEINYWYAYHLMHYQEAHLSIAAVESLYMPDAYFDFLNEILINNDAAFIHPFYSPFLELYYPFRLEKPDFPYGLASKQLVAVPILENSPIFSDVECTQKIGQINAAEMVISLEKVSYQAQHQAMPLVYRIKVKSLDGRFGYMRSTEVELYNFAPKLNQNKLYIKNYDVETTRDFVRCTTITDSLGVFDDPSSKKPLTVLPLGTKLAMLNQTTIDNISYDSQTGYIAAPFARVRTFSGIMGWVSTAGVQTHLLRDIQFEFKSRIAPISKSYMQNLDFFFYDKALYYTFGKEIIEKLLFNEKQKVEPLFNIFQEQCPYNDLKLDLKKYYEKSVKKFVLDSSSMNVKEQLFDQRTSSINQRGSQFALAKDDKAFKKVDEKVYLNQFFNQNNVDSVCHCDPIKYPEVKYETKMVEIRGLKKLFKKYNFKLSISPDIVNNIEKNPVPKFLKSRKRLIADTLAYRFAILEPVYGQLNYQGQEMKLWLEPGQKYVLKEENNEIKLEGEGNDATHFANTIGKSINRLDSMIYKSYFLSENEFKKLVLSEHIKQKEAFSYFLAKAKVSRTFIKTAEADIDYWLVNHLLKYAYARNKNNPISVNYYNFLQEEIKIQNERAILSKAYQEFVKIYLDKQIAINQHLRIPDNDIARMTFSGRVLNFWQAKYISERLKRGFSYEILTFAQQFIEDCTYTILIESVKNSIKISNFNKQKFQINHFALTDTKNKSLYNIDFQGKNTAIVFWAKNEDRQQKEERKIVQKRLSNLGYNTYFVFSKGSYHDWKKSIPALRRNKNHLYYEDIDIYAANINQNLQLPVLLFDKKGIFNKKDYKSVVGHLVQ